MKKIDLGQGLTLLANLGVIAGIVFLAIEIRDSAEQAANEALQSAVAQYVDWHKQIASDPGTARIYMEGRGNYGELSELDKVRFGALMKAILHSVSIFIATRESILIDDPPPIHERSAEGYLFELLEQPGFQQWRSTSDLRGLPITVLTLLDELEQMGQGDAASGQ